MQLFICKEKSCHEAVTFEYSPIFKSKKKRRYTTFANAYLTCSRGHTHMYVVTIPQEDV